ncbi:MAG: hypothetical protein HOV68_24890 [Streptomycetaceae bacterium]|nr:hypothetical protein [Streptomycetaceae bacterium]
MSAIEEDVATLDVVLAPIVTEPIDITDPDWVARMRAAPDPVDRAGVRAEAEAVLAEIVDRYAEDEAARPALRALFERYGAFRSSAHLPSAATPDGIRVQLLHLSVRDQQPDTRDEILTLRAICAQAREAGVDVDPILREVAAISSDVDRYGMGSTRAILLREAGRG